MKSSTYSALENGRSLEVIFITVLLGVVGLGYAIFPLVGLTFRELNIETFLAVSGVFLLVAVVGLWYGRQMVALFSRHFCWRSPRGSIFRGRHLW
jgi:hypothetical protein